MTKELPNTIDTATLRAITGYSKAGITDLENAQVITRSAVNAWPFPETVTKLIAHLRERVRKTAVSDQRSRWESARASREQLRLQREAHELCKTSEFDTAVDFMAGAVLRHLGPVPARCAPTDIALRRRIEAEIDTARAGIADDCERQADSLHGTGKAA